MLVKNFIDSNNGSISGAAKDDQGKPLLDVKVELQTPDRAAVQV
jgi:hypothetical protein